MGIVNLTDNSYFSSSRCLDGDGLPDRESFLAAVRAHVCGGAEIIDLGACSSRPGAVPVSAEQEWSRLEPALDLIKRYMPDVRISIDTFRSGIVRKAFEIVGSFMVNDISAGEDDELMLPTVAELELPYVAMHKRGTSETMQQMTRYDDVVEEVLQYFRDFSLKAEKAGVRDWILDPGFGFAKTIDQNYELLAGLGRFRSLGRRILVGVSRKSMIYSLLGITPEEALPATQVLHLKALQGGASILRVHDSAEAARTVEIWKKLG
ncbi:MAG: dihydropteroate synthase [Bacteroidales bacterium]|nr:dihydropteroate synthase [Bacteroidales bacterium]